MGAPEMFHFFCPLCTLSDIFQPLFSFMMCFTNMTVLGPYQEGGGRQTEQTSVLMGTTYFLTNSALDSGWHFLSFNNFFSHQNSLSC